MPRSTTAPQIRRHRNSAYITLSGKRVYLGRHDDPNMRRRYDRVVTEWLAGGRQLSVDANDLTVVELIDRFMTHAGVYYGPKSQEPRRFADALRILKQSYGRENTKDFGPLALKATRQQMIDKGWSRRHINQSVQRLVAVSKWAASEELIPADVYHALKTVNGLRRGRTTARESRGVRPVPDGHVERIQPYVSDQVWALIRLLLLTGARPGELIIMRPVDLDTSAGPVWCYSPAQHKTDWRGHERRIYIGPQARAVLAPFLSRPVDAYLFSPAEAEAQRRAKRATGRRRSGQIPTPKLTTRKLRRHYDVNSLRRAIAYGCAKAGITPWTPGQLRHNAATVIRRDEGIEVARIILGHRSPSVTLIYAEQDEQKAIQYMRRRGWQGCTVRYYACSAGCNLCTALC